MLPSVTRAWVTLAAAICLTTALGAGGAGNPGGTEVTVGLSQLRAIGQVQ